MANALTYTGYIDQDYTFDEDPIMDGSTAADVKSLIGTVESEELTVDERVYARFVIEQLDEAIDANDVSVLGDIEGLIAAYFVMFELGEAHPGPIPPPFPDE